MSRAFIVLATICAAWSVGPAQAAEDHSAHQPAADPHAEHHSDAPAAREHSSEVHSAHDKPTESELRHVPPPPPQHVMGEMSNERMIELMQMEDDAPVGMVLVDQLERREIEEANAIAWDARAWYGDDYNKAWLKVEGERVRGEYEGRTELLWDRVVSRWWSLQSGLRHDFGEGPSRTWAAFGTQGLAPYWFEVEATVYVGEEGRTAARAEAEYEILLTQRLILQPDVEINLYGKDDPANGIGSGLSDAEIGLRLRYEIRREFAPYVGVMWTRLFGETADIARADGHDNNDVQFVAGLRAWF